MDGATSCERGRGVDATATSRLIITISTMKKTQTQTSNSSALIRAVLSTEAKFVLSIVAFVMGVVAPYYQMRQDVALIQKDISIINTNHSAHIQDLSQDVKDTITVLQAQQNQINVLQTQQAIILERLK